MDFHQANLHPNLILFNSPLSINLTPTSLGVTFDRNFYFSAHVSSLRQISSFVSRFYPVYLLLLGLPPRTPFLLYTKLFSGPFSLILHVDDLHFLALPMLLSGNTFTKRSVASLSIASRLLSSLVFSLRRPYFVFESF